MNTDSWILAIDFGTSYSVAACRRDGQAPEVIEIDGDRRIPSVVMVTDDFRVVVGRAADEMSAALTSRVLRSAKSRLGDPAPIILGGKPFQVASLVAEMLAKMFDEAVRHQGCAPSSTRLTYPASWNGQRQQQLLRAAELAGLPAPTLVLEPVAAAVSYADTTDQPIGSNVLVYDLGGGTLDCAVLRSTDEGFDLIGRPSGDRQLGGELFDELLANSIGERLPEDIWENLQLGQDAAWSQAWVGLRREARRAKELLSTQPVVDLLVALPNGIREVRVTRDEVESVIGPYIADSVQILVNTCEDAGLARTEIDGIYLVGGGSRMPLVEVLIAQAFPGVPISRRGDPKSAVALGATHPHAVVGQHTPLRPNDQVTDPRQAGIALVAPIADAAKPSAPVTRVVPSWPDPAAPSGPKKRRSLVAALIVVGALVAVGTAFALVDGNSGPKDGTSASSEPNGQTGSSVSEISTTSEASTEESTTSAPDSTVSETTMIATTTVPAATSDLLTALQQNPDFNEFLFLADVAGLTETLRTETDLTVFVPSNEALSAGFAGTLFSVPAVAGSPAASWAIVAQHLVKGQDLTVASSGIFETWAGTQISVEPGLVADIPFGDDLALGTNGSAWPIGKAIVPAGFSIEASPTTGPPTTVKRPPPGTTVPPGNSPVTTVPPIVTSPTTAPPSPVTDPTIPPTTAPSSGPVPAGLEGGDPSFAVQAINTAGFPNVVRTFITCATASNVVSSYTPQGTQPFTTTINVVICR